MLPCECCPCPRTARVAMPSAIDCNFAVPNPACSWDAEDMCRCLFHALCYDSCFTWQPGCDGAPSTQCADIVMLLQVSGIIIGMLLMGYIADQIGRKWGSVLTSAFMFIGGILLTCSTGPTIQGWAIMFAISQFIFGYGVGGKAPSRKNLHCPCARRLRRASHVRARPPCPGPHLDLAPDDAGPEVMRMLRSVMGCR